MTTLARAQALVEIARGRRAGPTGRNAVLSLAWVCSFVLHAAILALSAAWAAAPIAATVEDGLVFVSIGQLSAEAPSTTALSAPGIRPRPAAAQKSARSTAVRGGRRDRARDVRARTGDPRAFAALATGAAAPPPPQLDPRSPGRSEIDDRPTPSPTPAPTRAPEVPALLSPASAAALRIAEDFPSMPPHVRARHASLVVELRVCVSPEGTARAEGIGDHVDPAVRRIIEEAIASWRYRPLISEGRARSFCHRLSLQYSS